MAGQPLNVFVTSDLVLAMLNAIAEGPLLPLFVAVLGQTLSVSSLCSQRPPAWVDLDSNVHNNSLGDVLQDLQAIAWPYFCECVPGSPAPINFPPPAIVVPPNIPSFPTFPCDPADLCSSISAIRQQVYAIATQLQSTSELVTLLQRYGLPFAYAPGAVHQGLTGEGQFAISRL